MSRDYELLREPKFYKYENNSFGAPNPQDIEDMIHRIRKKEKKMEEKEKVSIEDLDNVLNEIYINGMKCGIRCTLSNIIELCNGDMGIEGIKAFCEQTLANYKKGQKLNE